MSYGNNRTVCLFGGSFNPPGTHHRAIAQFLTEHFHEVLVVPCGIRPDKATSTLVSPEHRAAIIRIAFADIPRVTLDLTDLERDIYTPTWELDEYFKSRGELWHAIGADLVAGGNEGLSEIQRTWTRGDYVWENLRFAVITRNGYGYRETDLPPHARVLPFTCIGSSTTIRKHLATNEPLDGLVDPSVLAYIRAHGLYRASATPPPSKP